MVKQSIFAYLIKNKMLVKDTTIILIEGYILLFLFTGIKADLVFL